MTQPANTYPTINQGWGIIGIFLGVSILAIPIYIILQPLLPPSSMTFVYYTITMGGVFMIAHSIRQKSTALSTYNFKLSSPKIILLIPVLVIALQLGVIIPVVSLIPMPDFVKEMFRKFMGEDTIFSFLTIVIAAPFLEELLFRGVILDGFLKRYSPAKSIGASSAFFGLIHLNPWQFIGAFILGSFAGWVYYKTQKLSFCVWIHASNNFLAFLLMKLQDKDYYDQSLIEMYGGLRNTLFGILGAIAVGLICFYYLASELDRHQIQMNLGKVDEETDSDL